jgi:hypothetical protein
MMNLATRSALFLLAAMVGTVFGVDIGWKIMGVTTIGEPCSEKVQEAIFQECVIDMGVSMGVVGPTRRLELRGNRELTTTGSTCGGCYPDGCSDGSCWPPGTWCYKYCDTKTTRRLLTAERFLEGSEGQLHQAANECLDNKIPDHPCLGEEKDLTVKLYISE